MSSLSGVGVIDKSMAVLAALRTGPLDLAALQEVTGLPRATAHRLAAALEVHHLVRRDSNGRFCLGLELVALGRSAAEQFGVAAVAMPVLAALRDDTGESVQLFVREDGMRRCVVSMQSPHGLRWIVPEGSLLPLDAGSAGRVLSSVSPVGTWVQSVEERERGVASVSAPVLDSAGTVVAAVSVSGPIERMSRQPGKRFGAAVADAGRSISTALAR
jgi:DNA-binding IclR family transcriptional regulator